MIDENLKEYATEKQWEYYCEAQRHGVRGASRKLGVSHQTVGQAVKTIKRKASCAGYAPEYGHVHKPPPGFLVKGTSTLHHSEKGQVLQWVKTDRDQEQQLKIIQDYIKELAKELQGNISPTPAPETSTDELMASYVIGDAHIGMYSWQDETLEADFDSDIAVAQIQSAIDYLINAAPPSDKAMLVNVGDFLHMDNRSNKTPQSGNQLDVDTRYSRVIKLAVFALRYCIDQLLKKHKEVTVINAQGNHDQDTAGWLSLALSLLYEREKRVKIDDTPSKFHYHQFGSNLIGVTHSDGIKENDLPLIMATDVPELWGVCKNRYWWTGHIHHKRNIEHRGCYTESFNTLAPGDAWHAGKGYRSRREMQMIVLHKDQGIVARAIYNGEQA